MNILILGGTGVMGRELVNILERENLVYVTSRYEQSDYRNIHYIKGNGLELDFIKELLNKTWDAIIDFMNYSTIQFKERYRMFLNATKHYIYLSSCRVYADSCGKKITENFPRLLDICDDKEYLQTDEYALKKARQENLLIQSDCRNFTIVRPYITYGFNRLQLCTFEREMWLWRALHGKTVILPMDIGKAVTTMTYGADVARGISKLLWQEAAFGEAVHITGHEFLTWKEIWQVYAEVIDKLFHSCVKCKEIDSLSELPKQLYEKYQYKYDRLYDRRFDNSKFENLTGMCVAKDFLGVQEGIRICLQAFYDSKISVGHFPRVDAIFDKISGERTEIRYFEGITNKLKYALFRNIPYL